MKANWTEAETETLSRMVSNKATMADMVGAFPWYSRRQVEHKIYKMHGPLNPRPTRIPMVVQREYLACVQCRATWPVVVPEAAKDLAEVVKKNGTCQCGSKRVVRL